MKILITPSDIIERALWQKYQYYILEDVSQDLIDKMVRENKEFEIPERDAIVIKLVSVIETNNLISRLNNYVLELISSKNSSVKQTPKAKSEPKFFYLDLDITPEGTYEEIKNAYLEKSKNKTGEELEKLSKAYKTLSDPKKRKAYDNKLNSKVQKTETVYNCVRKNTIIFELQKFMRNFPETWEPNLAFKHGYKELVEYIKKLEDGIDELEIIEGEYQGHKIEYVQVTHVKKLLNFNH